MTEEDLLSMLYKDKYLFIQNYLMKLGSSLQDAEDIAQNTFTKAIVNNIHTTMKNPISWLFRVARNEYFTLCKKKNREITMYIEPDGIEQLLSTENGESILLGKESRAAIQHVLGELTPAFSNLLLFKYEFEMSYEQIASLLDMKVDTVKTSLYRARIAFKKKWSEHDEKF